MSPKTISKKNIILVASLIFGAILLLIFRVGWIQIVKGDEYTSRAIEQQTKDKTLKAERGVIYDTNGAELAVSVSCYSIWLRPDSVKVGENKKEIKKNIADTTSTLEAYTGVDSNKIAEILNSGEKLVCVARGLDKDSADLIRKSKVKGIEVVEDTKRNYPLDDSAAHVIGSVNIDNEGLSGLELQYDSYLSGVSGRWITYTDTGGRQLANDYGDERHFKAKDGYNLVTTLDHVVQHYLEDALAKAQKKTRSKRVMGIVMEVETGRILAMGQTPSFNLNTPMEPTDDEDKVEFRNMDSNEQTEYLSDMWRNSLICDVYEPGSTFKLITTSTALEENDTKENEKYECNTGYEVAGRFIKCWAYPDSHGVEDLREAVNNSCNPVFMQIALKIGIDTFYEYLDTFGVTEKTGIDFPGETTGILQDKDSAGDIGLATIGFGQGVALTPIELITAVCSIGNEGKLMKPHLVKEMTDSEGETVQSFEPEMMRRTVSKRTAKKVCDIMEYVAGDGGGASMASVPGYRVGAKTGTANKLREDGRGYGGDTYSSCIAMAPMNDPKVAVLIIVDSPKGNRFGSVTAAPAVGNVLSKTLPYMNISADAKTENADAKDNKDDRDDSEMADDSLTLIKVPNVVGLDAQDAIDTLESEDLDYDLDDASEDDEFTVIKQYPAAGTEVKEGTKVYLYEE